MIISKEQNLNNKATLAFIKVRESLVTQRGSSVARAEMYKLRQQSFETNECPYCRATITDRSPRRVEACTDCSSKIDRMLITKSKIINSFNEPTIKTKTFEAFVDDLASLKYVPVALGGDRADEILDCCNQYLLAVKELDDYHKQQRREEIAKNLRNKRIAALRTEYDRYVDQFSEEEFNEIIESQYVQRYSSEII